MFQTAHRPETRSSRAHRLLIAAIALMSLLVFVPVAMRIKASMQQTPKFVMVGDSYSTISPKRGCLNPWPERVSAALGIQSDNCTIYRHDGYGFGRPDRRFVQLLEDVERDPTVTDVLIVGGAGNDRDLSKEELLKWYRITIERLRQLYPNATIMHTITSWDINDADYRAKIVEHIPWYKREAKRLGVVYLHGCAKTIREHPEWFCADGRHPNDMGQEAMSKVIVEKIRRYNERYAE